MGLFRYAIRIVLIMDWKVSLDKYLTSGPDCNFDNWADLVTESFSDDFFNKNEEWILEYDGVCNDWLNRLYHKEPTEAAGIIERSFRLYIERGHPIHPKAFG